MSSPVRRKRSPRRRRVVGEDKVTIIGMDELVIRIETGDRWLDRLFDCGWVRDQDLECCMVCAEDFNPLIRRRHHCRLCGNLICADCSTVGHLVVNNRDEYDILCCVQCCYGQVIYMTEGVEECFDHHEAAGKESSIALVHTTLNAAERLLTFALDCNRNVRCDILLVKHCSWDEICRAVIAKMGLPIKDIQSFVIIDEDGEVGSPSLGSSINFWQYVLRSKTFAGRCLLVQLTDAATKRVVKHISKLDIPVSHPPRGSFSGIVSSVVAPPEGSQRKESQCSTRSVSFEPDTDTIPF